MPARQYINALTVVPGALPEMTLLHELSIVKNAAENAADECARAQRLTAVAALGNPAEYVRAERQAIAAADTLCELANVLAAAANLHIP